MRRARNKLPWAMALAYGAAAPFVAASGGSEHWGYLFLVQLTFPAGIGFMFFSDWIRRLMCGDPFNPAMCTGARATVFYNVAPVVYVGGGALWFFAIGLLLRWVFRPASPRSTDSACPR